MIRLICGECLEEMSKIPDSSIDMVLCDLPYGVTANRWDSVIPFDLLWEQYERVIKDDGVIVLFGREPFTSMLICSNLPLYRYSWTWVKEHPTGFLNSAYRPLQSTEDIVVFSKAKVGSNARNKIRYNPQGAVEVNKVKRNSVNSSWRNTFGYSVGGNVLNSDKEYVQRFTNLPNNVLHFSRDGGQLHPTQKPVALLEYLIKTYTKEGDLVLDNCAGSFSTGVAAQNTDRDFIGIELDEEYFRIGCERMGMSIV